MARTRALLLSHARILTQDVERPRAEALLAVDGLVSAVGSEAEVRAAARRWDNVRALDDQGLVVVPGFIDAHVHLLAFAAKLRSVDCSPESAGSIAAIKARIGERAAVTPPGGWVRAAGYDEARLAEGRHPTRADLDEAAPAHPVRLIHRTGHACVLNSRALALAGIDTDTAEPPGAFIDRDLTTGAPSGLLIEMDELLEGVVPRLDYDELALGVAAADRQLIAAGVTYVEDASAGNGRQEWDTFERLIGSGHLRVGVSLMEGYGHAGEAPSRSAGGGLVRGGVKIAPRELEHEVFPGPAELSRWVRAVDGEGRQVAVHAVGRAAVEAATGAFRSLDGEAVRARRHRVEHAGICSEATAAALADLGVTVVTQPGFLYWNGDAYQRRVPAADQRDLYPLRRLVDAGVSVAGSTDAPVSPPDVIAALRAAVTRRSQTGAALAPEQAVSGATALTMFTREAARAVGVERERGALRPGLRADFAVLSRDPTDPAVDWDSLRVVATFISGEQVYAGGPAGDSWPPV